MPITQILLTANSGPGGGGTPAINIYGWVSPMNEGSTNTVTVDYENYPLTTIYWQIVDDGTSNDDFIAGEPGGAQLGNFQISGTGSTNFSWTTTEDLTTEGNENYLLQVGTFLGGANLLNETLTITDTSITPPTPTYSLAPGGSNSVDEGSSLQFNVGGTDVPAGTYYWTIETGAEDFATTTGTVSVSSGTGLTLGSFTVTPTADLTTEGTETFTVSLRSGSITGDILATSQSANINDTSLALVPPFSLEFNQPQGDYLSTPASADWNLGTSWTIEFWLNANSTADGNSNMSGGIWGLLNQESWAATNAINIALTDSKLIVGQGAEYDDVRYTEPTPAQWTHVAVVNNAGTQKVFYNGVEQTKVSGTFSTANYTNSTDSLAIGNISGGNNNFDGKMAMVRISNTAKYSAAFTPSVTYGVGADTVLFLDSDTPLVDTSYYELNGVSVVTNTLTTIYISKSAYPNLDKQVRVGNTVTKVSDSTTCIVTEPVFTADPDNWGVDVSPGWSSVGTVNFSGARHTIVNNGVTESMDFPIGSMTAYVSGWNIELQRLMPIVSGNPDLTPVVAGWTVTGPLDFTATVVEVSSNGTNWLIVVDASLAEFTGFNAGNYTFTPPA